jgi:hypothetical protein
MPHLSSSSDPRASTDGAEALSAHPDFTSAQPLESIASVVRLPLNTIGVSALARPLAPAKLH